MDNIINYSENAQQNLLDMRYGMRVDRAAELIPQTTTTDFFTIANGNVLVTFFYGLVTVSIGSATNMAFLHTPTTGTAAAIGADLAMAAFDDGDVLTVTGIVAGACVPAAHAGSVMTMSHKGIIMTPGVITCDTDGSSSTGKMSWHLFYVPLEDGAIVTAA